MRTTQKGVRGSGSRSRNGVPGKDRARGIRDRVIKGARRIGAGRAQREARETEGWSRSGETDRRTGQAQETRGKGKDLKAVMRPSGIRPGTTRHTFHTECFLLIAPDWMHSVSSPSEGEDYRGRQSGDLCHRYGHMVPTNFAPRTRDRACPCCGHRRSSRGNDRNRWRARCSVLGRQLDSYSVRRRAASINVYCGARPYGGRAWSCPPCRAHSCRL
jgi:hypothetical protein